MMADDRGGTREGVRLDSWTGIAVPTTMSSRVKLERALGIAVRVAEPNAESLVP
jgi:hypothetical protein